LQSSASASTIAWCSMSFSASSDKYRKFPDPHAGSSTRNARNRSRKPRNSVSAAARARRAAGVPARASAALSNAAAIRALAASHSASSGRRITGSISFSILSRSV